MDGRTIGQDAAASDASSDASPDAGIDAAPLPATNDLCANAISINLATMHVAVPATTTGATPNLAAPCGTAGTPDVFFTFTLTRPELVYADTFGATANTALFFASACDTARTASTTAQDAVCSSGACETGQSQVIALLDPGTHYLVLASQGAATIHFQHVEVGNGPVAHLGSGATSPTGTTSGFGFVNACEAAAPENSYWWRTCPADVGGVFAASTCTATDTAFDTILRLQIPGTELVMCNNDDASCSDQAKSTVGATIPAGAGLFVLSVDGDFADDVGNYTLTASRP